MAVARRRPTQERARRTVERILDAAGEVLAEVGYDAASTNRIAAAAGVSPGTLYGYFNDKDDIVAAVIERAVADFGAAVAPALQEAAGRPIDQGTRHVLDAVVAALEARAALIEGFLNRIPVERYAGVVDALRARVLEVVFHLVAAQRPGADRQAIEGAAWIAVRAVEHLCVSYAVDPPPISRDAFLDQLTAMVIALAPEAQAELVQS